MSEFDVLPQRAGRFTSAGLTEALERSFGERRILQRGLERDPRSVVRRVVFLTDDQQTLLDRMSDSELQDLVRPVVEALRDGRKFRIEVEMLDSSRETEPTAGRAAPQQGQPPAPKKKCRLKVEFEVEL